MKETQKGLLSYMEKRRGGREIEVTRRRRGGNQKEREQSSQYANPYVLFTAWNTLREVHGVT